MGITLIQLTDDFLHDIVHIHIQLATSLNKSTVEVVSPSPSPWSVVMKPHSHSNHSCCPQQLILRSTNLSINIIKFMEGTITIDIYKNQTISFYWFHLLHNMFFFPPNHFILPFPSINNFYLFPLSH